MLDPWTSFAIHRITYITPWALSVLPATLFALALSRIGRLSPHLRHALLWIALLGFLLPPITPYLPNVSGWILGWMSIPELTDRTMGVAGESSVARNILLFHLLGWTVLALRLASDSVRLHRMHRRATLVRSGPLYEQLCRTAQRLEIARPPRLLLSSDASAPFLSGAFRPAVTIPTELAARLNSEALGHVFAHELIHHRNRDVWLNLLRLAICSFWFFNPIVWILGRAISNTREECCDATLLAELAVRPRAYSQSLLEAAEISVQTGTFGFSAGMFGQGIWPLDESLVRRLFPFRIQSPLETRLRLLATTSQPARGLRGYQKLGLALILVLLLPPAPGESDAMNPHSHDHTADPHLTIAEPFGQHDR